MTSKKSGYWKALAGFAILSLCIFAILFWKVHIPKPSAQIKEMAEPKKEEPAKPVKVVLRSSLAGKWYAGDAETLSRQIDGFLAKAEVVLGTPYGEPIDNVIALILPHAGYRFSGQTAAFGLKTTDKKYERVVVIGPSHRVPMQEVLSVPRVTHYETPLGQIPLDVEFIDRLLKYPMFQNVPQAHKYEHSVQIELPLLQYVQQNFKLVPIVAGACSQETIGKAAAVLRSLVDEKTLVVASSDFVHYGANYGYMPFEENIPEQIKKLDMGAYEHIAGLDGNGFLEYKRKTGATICGYIPIAILLSMLDEPVEVELIKYATSGELTGDFTNSVSYLSIAFSGTWRKRSTMRSFPTSAKTGRFLLGNCPPVKPQAAGSELTEADKKQLLTLARESIVHFLRKRRVPQAYELNVTISDTMRDPRAAFVTLKRDSRLRGCMGDIFPRQPLYKSVISNAINAAVNDRRFPPIAKTELNDITVEISALTAPEPVASPDEIRIGIDGVVLNKDGRSAVYLPQVASEQGWNVNQMLTQLSLKARLGADAWKEGANFLVFQADVFGEQR